MKDLWNCVVRLVWGFLVAVWFCFVRVKLNDYFTFNCGFHAKPSMVNNTTCWHPFTMLISTPNILVYRWYGDSVLYWSPSSFFQLHCIELIPQGNGAGETWRQKCCVKSAFQLPTKFLCQVAIFSTSETYWRQTAEEKALSKGHRRSNFQNWDCSSGNAGHWPPCQRMRGHTE